MKQFNLEEYLANPRKVVTRHGKDVSIVYTDGKKIDYPIIALVDTGWEKLPLGFTKDGEYRIGEVSDCDLFFAPEKHTDYINLYRNGDGYFLGGGVYTSEENAKYIAYGDNQYITTIKVEWEE